MNADSPNLTSELVLEELKQVIDPEVGLNIVDMGLVYDVRLDNSSVHVSMTLTTMGCPMHESIVQGARRALLSIPGVHEAEVELVWDPPWHPAMMSRAASEALAERRSFSW
jgi:metal-sulfur cluster biosynthetic enzyme